MIVTTRDNQFALRVFTNGSRKTDLSTVTRWIVWVGTEEIDSLTEPDAFDWLTDTDDGGDLLVLSFGAFTLPAGDQPVRVTYFDAANQLGVEADNVLRVPVREAAAGTTADAPASSYTAHVSLYHSYVDDPANAPVNATICWRLTCAPGDSIGWVKIGGQWYPFGPIDMLSV